MSERERSWLLLIYKIPPEPSRNRVYVWRKIRGIGAIYIRNSVCIIPELQPLKEEFEKLDEEIKDLGGESTLLEVTSFSSEQEEELIGKFKATRDKEYKELIDQCKKFFAEIEKETDIGNFTSEEVEEEEQELEKLKNWFERIKARDWFGAELQDEARANIAHCEALLNNFATEVYELIGEDKEV